MVPRESAGKKYKMSRESTQWLRAHTIFVEDPS